MCFLSFLKAQPRLVRAPLVRVVIGAYFAP
jgi:hypothetical protein